MPLLRTAILLLTLLLTACTPGSPALSSQTQTVDGLTITLEATAAPRINDRQLFTVLLSDAQGQPVVADDVYLDFDMPAMPMGTNRPIAEAAAPGRYTAVTVYTMSGDWTIDVVVTWAGTEYRAQFTMLVSE
ncbi:MAG: FixH family protein [Oscillochloridaceae bacterium umkhey_bin13]